MKNQPGPIKIFLLENVAVHPQDLVAVAMRQFGVTRTTVHRHLNRLIRQGAIIKTGIRRGVRYSLKSARDKNLVFEISPELQEHKIWMEFLKDDFSNLALNIRQICDYAFGEIFNNAIDHSEGKHIWVRTRWQPGAAEICIFDDGIGIFRKIQRALNLTDERESILHLTKGKFSTDPRRHSGEGIFFTSRVVDRFAIDSFGLTYHRIRDEDWYVQGNDQAGPGTRVRMTINLNSPLNMKDVFASLTTINEEDGIPSFDKTHIWVQLSKLEEETLISRSQAKRILSGLEKFRHVVLDFRDVPFIGQGFVDEVFRVYAEKHPEIRIEWTNANDDVRFMIERGIPR
ncbi:MAG: ArsR family transcriptional regulator [Nitrospinae bacterium CG11_big_fil_rev_8_21_14_0_20_56_8]|nr:MAG: ArsR family transcriptional regulator [Nitrospinae bacterium CG11_big_fil_rev_8_21_14_0_20_56_8]